jgi:hypothetical protein
MDEMQPAREDRTLRSRYELKYLVHEHVAAALEEGIRTRMRRDHFSAAQRDGFYPIASLYLDSSDLRLHRESVDGAAVRFKLRVRTYSDGTGSPCFFEIKRRSNGVISKHRARVARTDVRAMLDCSASAVEGDATGDLRRFRSCQVAVAARPVLLVAYRRKAYETEGVSRLRVTFDRDVRYSPWHEPSVAIEGPRWERIPRGRVIVEIKFTGRFPSWIAELARRYGFVAQSVSKYSISLQHAGLLGYRAPKRVAAWI